MPAAITLIISQDYLESPHSLDAKEKERFCYRKRKEKKNYAGSENHSPHEVKEKKAIFVPSTVKLLYRRQKRSSRRGPEQSTRRRK